jgi:hypothetical protein
MKKLILDYFWKIRPDLVGSDAILSVPLRMLLSSVEFVEFLAFLEESFAFTIGDNEVTEESFANVASVIEFLERKSAQQ